MRFLTVPLSSTVVLSISLISGLSCGPDEIGVDVAGTEEDSQTTGTVEDKQDDIDNASADLDAIVTATVAYFNEPHLLEGTDYYGEAYAPHRCPHPEGSNDGEAGITPPLSLSCAATNDGLCQPSDEPDQSPGSYDANAWYHNSVWQATGFAKTEAHAFHYNIMVNNHPGEYGSCHFTAQAFADLDNDTIFSTYERRGYIDEDGLELEPLFIDKPCE